jgi:hypothetical protein
MTREEIGKAKDKDLAASQVAMRRAAQIAREQAIRTDTAIVVTRNQRLVRVTAEELRKEGRR